jgi:hypothetical protein
MCDGNSLGRSESLNWPLPVQANVEAGVGVSHAEVGCPRSQTISDSYFWMLQGTAVIPMAAALRKSDN